MKETGIHDSGKEIIEITEGTTKLLVPAGSLSGAVPPREVAFYNPKAKNNRDVSIAAYLAFLGNFDGPRIMLEPLAGIGARGLRTANEADDVVLSMQHTYLNDINSNAVELAKRSAALNNLGAVSFTNDEACRFLSNHTARGTRGAIVDIDPFGSPAPFFDCAIRAVMHGGMISCTATDLQVLNGLFDHACQNRYGGVPIRGITYGNEIAIRLVLGCLRAVAARLDVSICPVFASAEMHYYRMYVLVMVKNAKEADNEIGYAVHCDACGNRKLTRRYKSEKCSMCGETEVRAAGPLWTGPLFEQSFIDDAKQNLSCLLKNSMDKKMIKYLEKALEESTVQSGLYYTADEMASRTKSSPPCMSHVISKLRKEGFAAAQTSLSRTGFRTNAPLDVIKGAFS